MCRYLRRWCRPHCWSRWCPGLYFTVNTCTDPVYRQRFFEPLIADVAVSLAGRDAYLELEGANR